MKILFVLEDIPVPPTNGIRITLFNTLRHFSQKNECDVLCFGYLEKSQREEFTRCFPNANLLGVYKPNSGLGLRIRQFGSLFTDSIPSAERFKNKRFFLALRTALNNKSYDLVHMDLLNVASYRKEIINTPTVLAANDAISLHYNKMAAQQKNPFKKLYFNFLSKKIFRYEKKWYPLFEKIRVVSESDKTYYEKLAGIKNIEKIPISVNREFVRGFKKQNIKNRKLMLFSSGGLSLFYIRNSLMSFLENHWNALREKFPNLKFVIIGRGADRQIKERLKKVEGVSFAEETPLYRQLLQKATVAVFFDRGGVGMKNRTSQALASSKIVLGYPEAFLGLDVRDGLNCLIVNSEFELKERLDTVLSNYDSFQKLGKAAGRFMLKNGNIKKINQKWDLLHTAALSSWKNKLFNNGIKPTVIVPNFFIVGAPKSGTTALSEYLKTHPNLFFSGVKEPHFFDTDMSRKEKINLPTYLALFAKADPNLHKSIGEGSTGYLFSKTAVPEILKFNPNAKFIVMLRNPIDLVPSWHSEMFSEGVENIHDFEQAWRAEKERRVGKRIPLSCSEPRKLFYSEWGRLGDQMERLFSEVSMDKVKVILFEDFVSNSKRVYEETLSFLGLPQDGRQAFEPVNESKELKIQAIQRILALLANNLRLIRAKSGLRLGLGLGLFPQLFFINSRIVKRKPLTVELREELRKYYRQDVQKLSRLIRRDLSHWVEHPKLQNHDRRGSKIRTDDSSTVKT